MRTSFCAQGHKVWWGSIDSHDEPFVEADDRYQFVKQGDTDFALPATHCFRPHSEICDSIYFTSPEQVAVTWERDENIDLEQEPESDWQAPPETDWELPLEMDPRVPPELIRQLYWD